MNAVCVAQSPAQQLAAGHHKYRETLFNTNSVVVKTESVFGWDFFLFSNIVVTTNGCACEERADHCNETGSAAHSFGHQKTRKIISV